MEDRHSTWLERAQEACPKLTESLVEPAGCVETVADPVAFQGFACVPAGEAAQAFARELKAGDAITFDFGRHVVGRLRLAFGPVREVVDAPLRLKLTLAETPLELAEPFETYRGSLCRSWLQDEVVNIDWLPAEVELPRRYAFRYARVEVVATPRPVRLALLACRAVTSATGEPPAIPLGDVPRKDTLESILRVARDTLRNCMQTVFEDGPKRDRRLWLGDLRLQALADDYSFRRHDLVKRCLYLLAALPCDDGLVSACVYEYPRPVSGKTRLLDYALLYGATLLDYAEHSGDWATAEDLWPVARRQMDFLDECLDADGVFVDRGTYWLFVDWSRPLDRQAPLHAISVHGLKRNAELARRLGRPGDAAELDARAAAMTAAARRFLIDAKSGAVVSGPKRQVSVASAAWMVLAGVLDAAEGAALLRRLLAAGDVVRPAGPYLWHHVAEAMFLCGLRDEAIGLIADYWGGMIRRGATTFWEVFDPADERLSPYGDARMNSYCHAWSCGPAYLIPRYVCGIDLRRRK